MSLENTDPYLSECSVIIGSTNNTFINLAYTIPFFASSINAWLISLVTTQFTKNYKPTFFQLDYIYSASNNLINGNFKEKIEINKDIIKTIYFIPYDTENGEKISKLITYYNINTKILFYIIPREFSNNSIEEASVSFYSEENNNYIGTILIPSSFYTNYIPTYKLLVNFYLKNNSDGINRPRVGIKITAANDL